MVDAGGEVYLGGFEGVVCGEVDVEEEDSAGVGGVVGAHDCGLPVEHVVADGSGGAVRRGIFSEVDEFCWLGWVGLVWFGVLGGWMVSWVSQALFVSESFVRDGCMAACIECSSHHITPPIRTR